jgi:energy-coupling factor transport system substrate-specific component
MVSKRVLVKYATFAASVVIGAGLMFVLNRFISIPTGVSGTDIQVGIPILAFFAAVFGPIAGFFIGLIGHALVDLSWGGWGGIWWSWVIASAFFGLIIGAFRNLFKIEEGKFGVKQALIFNGIQAIANITAYVFIARILDLLMYNEPFDKLTLQGFVAAGVNIAAVLILGTILAVGYSQTLTKTGHQKNEDQDDSEMSYSKRINNLAKAVMFRLVLGMFFISALMTLLISELVNRQTDNYRTTVIEVTGHHLTSAVTALSQLVSVEELDLFHTVEDMNKPEYEQIRERLMEFGKNNNVFYAYYWRDCGNGTFQYIIDNDTDPETQVHPGQFNDIVQDAERGALAGNISVADLGSYSIGWEGLLSAYAPVYDRQGNIYAVAGVDISDEFIFLQHQDAHKMTLLQLIVVPISVIFGVLNMFLYRRKAVQIEEAHVKLQYFNNNLRRAFSTYLSEDVVEEIVSDPTRLQLGGVKRHMTAIFTDIRGFSGIAEKLPPEKLVDLLNHYLSTMSDVILEQKGTIDKYEGDAIIAFLARRWNFPTMPSERVLPLSL